MTDIATNYSCGSASIEPVAEVTAGSYGTWRLTYVCAGADGVAPDSAIRVDTECDTDWGIPQLADPQGAEYMTLQAPMDVRIGVLVEDVKSILLMVKGRRLQRGERLTLTYGDRTGGGPGSRAQTFLEGNRYFRVAVDTEGDGGFRTLPDSPYVTVIGGPAVKLVAIAPSTVIVGEPFRLLVKAEDEWGNPSKGYEGTVDIRAEGLSVPEARHTFGTGHNGVLEVEGCPLASVGVSRIRLTDSESKSMAQSNPIECLEKPARYSLYWADPHGGQVALRTKIRDFFRYARDVARLDFVGYQRNDHLVSKDDWAWQQEAEAEFSEPGRFIPLPGFEWSATTGMGGHHNVYSRRYGLPIRRNSHQGVEDKSDIDTDLNHVLDLYRAYRNTDVILTPHVGGEHGDLNYHEPSLEPALEITSTHGTFEWFLEEALQHRYKLGFVGGSDSHTGRPGADTPGHQLRRYAKAGLTGVYAAEVSLEAFVDALKARRCYATTGARIIMRVDGDGHLMGEEYTTSSPPTLSVSVAGTAALESLELYRGLEKIHSYPVQVTRDAKRVRILWEGASRKTSYSGVIWDGSVKVTGGKVTSVEKLRFDSPRSHVRDTTENGFRWYSVTCGYRSGVILTLDGDEGSEVEVVISTSVMSRPNYGQHGETGPTSMSYSPAESLMFSTSLGELADGPKEFDIGVLNRKVSVSLAPEQGSPETAEFTFTDLSPVPGINPYWVRAVQTDMEMAWTSPVFVDFAGE